MVISCHEFIFKVPFDREEGVTKKEYFVYALDNVGNSGRSQIYANMSNLHASTMFKFQFLLFFQNHMS